MNESESGWSSVPPARATRQASNPSWHSLKPQPILSLGQLDCTQSEAVAVRGLSLSHVGVGRLIGSELRTGVLIGVVLALLAFPMIWLVFGELRLAAAVTLALAGASVVASTLGLLLPWLLARTGADPAYGSGPLATIVQDVLSLLIYFGCVSAIVL